MEALLVGKQLNNYKTNERQTDCFSRQPWLTALCCIVKFGEINVKIFAITRIDWELVAVSHFFIYKKTE